MSLLMLSSYSGGSEGLVEYGTGYENAMVYGGVCAMTWFFAKQPAGVALPGGLAPSITSFVALGFLGALGAWFAAQWPVCRPYYSIPGNERTNPESGSGRGPRQDAAIDPTGSRVQERRLPPSLCCSSPCVVFLWRVHLSRTESGVCRPMLSRLARPRKSTELCHC